MIVALLLSVAAVQATDGPAQSPPVIRRQSFMLKRLGTGIPHEILPMVKAYQQCVIDGGIAEQSKGFEVATQLAINQCSSVRSMQSRAAVETLQKSGQSEEDSKSLVETIFREGEVQQIEFAKVLSGKQSDLFVTDETATPQGESDDAKNQ